MQETACDFIDTGKGCKANILSSEVNKHKKTAMGKHVDLLNEANKALQVIVKSQGKESKELRRELESLKETVP